MSNASVGPPLALLVEDDQDTRDIYSRFLADQGFDVIMVDSARAAFDAAVAHQPRVIIADVRLPGSADGITLTMKLRLDPRTRAIPIIIVTGDALRPSQDRALAAGCSLFLAKPCSPEVLATHARTLVAA
jgi:two-component system, cell cycle response regulator DivK